ncbi:MAG: hypothetical protein IIB19_00420, partial [Chloroflexi bacterium]|nr:hypothetical protein [Chloroflexota bacterium]
MILTDNGVPADKAQVVIDVSYPLGGQDAQAELTTRGLAATDREMYAFCRHPENGVRQAGQTYLWTKENIDALADLLEAKDKITFLALQRRDS